MFTTVSNPQIQENYERARVQYAAIGVDSDDALRRLAAVPVSLHCWQGDDVRGFEPAAGQPGGGIMATGSYPGAAADPESLRRDAGMAFALIPGRKRFNLHAIYAECSGANIPRDQITPEHFHGWMQWSRDNAIPLDFNPTYFGHPLAADGYTLSHADPDIRNFWVRHGIACRHIAAAFAKNQGTPCILNHWIPDGAKDQPVDRQAPRLRLRDALDAVFTEPVDHLLCKDAVECKLFGLGSEDYVVGSHEFYLAYTMRNPQMLCFDMGHFHPTETIHDKISAVLLFKHELLLHVSRGIRWDSDHVVIGNDDLHALCQQLVRCQALERTWLALDYFDASINRIGAWVIGCRALQKALLAALLEPTPLLRAFEESNDGAMKLALLEELKTFPVGAVWDMFCHQHNTPAGAAWIDALIDIDRQVTRQRR